MLWTSCYYLSSHPSHRVPTLSSNPLICLCSVFSGTFSFVYPIQILVVFRKIHFSPALTFLLSIFTPMPQSSYSVFKSTEMPLLCLQWHPFFCLPHTNSGCIRRYYHCLSPPFCLLSPLHRMFSPSVFHHRVRLCLLFTLSSLASNGRTVERWLFRKVRETILVDSIRVATNN